MSLCSPFIRAIFYLCFPQHHSLSPFSSYDTFVSSYFLPLEEAAAHGSSMRSFDSPACLLLSHSTINRQPSRQLVLLRNGNLMSSYFQVNGRRLSRKYFRISFPEDPGSPAYRGGAVASTANSDLFRLLCHFSEQLVYMRCSPLPLSLDALGDSVSIFILSCERCATHALQLAF